MDTPILGKGSGDFLEDVHAILPDTAPIGDLTGDGGVNVDDLLQLLGNWG